MSRFQERRELECDLVILGAGPAGSAAAIAAAQQGAQVILIEQEAFPRMRPGESLHPGIAPLLRRLGIEIDALDFPRYAGQEVRWGRRAEFVSFGGPADAPWLGYQAERAVFDARLLERAQGLGVRVLQPCRVQRPRKESERVTGVLTSQGEIHSRWVIDAGGGRHWLAQHLGLEVLRYSPRRLIEYGYCVGTSAICDVAPHLEGDADGWTWLSRVRPGFYHWCRLRLPSAPALPSLVLPSFWCSVICSSK